MKKSILSILAIATLTFTSCTKDSGDDKNASSFELVVDNLKGEITDGTVSLNASETYTLTGALVVKSGATLRIPAGTTIKSSATAAAQSLYIAVESGAKILVEGEENNPVVMTSGKASPAQSDWGGLVICGDAVTNVGTDATSEVASLKYGGTNNNDSSGSIEYLKISYTGANNGSDKEFNGVSFFAVGSGTVVDHIYTFESGDDGIEFFGGAVEATNLRIENSYDDSLDFADGFSGSVTNVYIKGVTKAGIEGSNNGEDTEITPLTNATISNVTIIKGDGFGASEQAINFKEGGGKQAYTNLYVEGISTACKLSDDAGAVARISAGDFTVTNYQFTEAGAVLNGATFTGTSTTTGAGAGGSLPTWADKF